MAHARDTAKNFEINTVSPMKRILSHHFDFTNSTSKDIHTKRKRVTELMERKMN